MGVRMLQTWKYHDLHWNFMLEDGGNCNLKEMWKTLVGCERWFTPTKGKIAPNQRSQGIDHNHPTSVSEGMWFVHTKQLASGWARCLYIFHNISIISIIPKTSDTECILQQYSVSCLFRKRASCSLVGRMSSTPASWFPPRETVGTSIETGYLHVMEFS